MSIMPSISPFKSFFFTWCIAMSSWACGAHTTHPEQSADITIRQLYHSPSILPKSNLSARIAVISRLFLNAPYALGALGEGPQGRYDQSPLYRTDAFDCETYVDTVLALALAHDLPSFQQKIRQIRYKNGHVSFIDRNHFTCLDWNRNNQRQGLVKDITPRLRDANHHAVALTAAALIDKPNWYQHLPISIIRLPNASSKEQATRLVALRQSGRPLPRAVSTLSYIPLSALFDHAGHANIPLFNQIPHGAIIELIRPNWDLKQQIGTHLNVSHLGFAIWDNGKLMFRHATSTQAHVVEVSLIDYLRETRKSPTIKGINIQVAIF